VTIARDEPIVAIATPAGRGGIGVVRLSFGAWSGRPIVARFHAALTGTTLAPRHATLVSIANRDGAVIDRGLALAFPAPHSYTGEDVLELQMHGGPAVLQLLVTRCFEVVDDVIDEGIDDSAPPMPTGRMRLARPGEFTERAFLNDKLDLAQAEAVADLIEAGSEAAVLGAQASLSGRFSDEVHALVAELTTLRALVEATLDFPEEEIDFLEQSDARGRLSAIDDALATLMARAQRGALLREGLTVVLIGRPNVGKSSLLNALAESEVAIVTPIAGTTRDRVEQTIRLEGIALHVVDTAGIRVLGEGPEDVVERVGIARTWEAIERAHVVLHLVDATAMQADEHPDDALIVERVPAHAARRTIVNKIDLVGDTARIEPARDDIEERLYVSAKTGDGIDLLRHELLAIAGWQPEGETSFIARERHLVALRDAGRHLEAARGHADQGDRQLDLFAEELRLAQNALGTITGAFTADDLLGEIFGKFCIGK